MLSNRTYLGIKDVALETDALKECAMHRAANRSRPHSRRSDRAFFQLLQDKRALMSAYKKLREHFEGGGEFSPAADVFCDNFYVVEKNLIALFNAVSEIKDMKLPACADGEFLLLPRVYAIAVEMVGHREGRVDESLIELYMEAYQSVTPLTIRETAALPYMLKTALIKLLKLESDECIDTMRSIQRADAAAENLIKLRDYMNRQHALLSKLELEKNPALLDRLMTLLADKNEYLLLERLHSNLEVMDIDAETLIIQNRRSQTRAAMLMQNAINSLRLLDSTDMEALFERICMVEHELSEDATYRAMDKKSRAYYRSCVERMAHSLKAAETSVARKALALAASGEEKGADEEKGQVGYYLFGDGKAELYTSIRPDKKYREYTHEKKLWSLITAQTALTIPLVFLAATGGFIPCMLSIFPAWTIANFVVVRIAVKRSVHRMIPRLSMENGIGEENRTLVVVPTLITDEKSLNEALENIETHYLANPLDNCYFAVLSDFPDSQEQITSQEIELLQKARELTEALNKKYAVNRDDNVFYFLHRHREFLISDDIYMGRERKRGALMALAEYIVTGESQQFNIISSPLPENIKYCVTLDADTVLPKESLSELIGAAAHPLNKPVLNENGVVTKGYGVIVPNMKTLASSAAKSNFARLYSTDAGLDIYASASGEFYQDIFSEGIFGGKGIFNIDVFYESLNPWIRDNAVLSHDLLEGSFLRAGYMSDVALYDSTPATFISWWKRSHRWIRGDWQLLPYLWFNIKNADGAWKKNPLSVLSRWKMLENIRKTMLCSGILYTVIVIPYIGMGFYALIALAAFLEDIVIEFVEFIIALFKSRKERYNAGGLFIERINTILRSIVQLSTLPYETMQTGDAMTRAIYRMFVSHKKLLEWQTASQSAGKTLTIIEYYKKLYICPLAGLVMAVSIFFGKVPLISALFAAIFILAPLIVFSIDKKEKDVKLDREMQEFLRGVARSTWRFFAELCNEKTAYLPPDNYQAVPDKGAVRNTSPTNIGMGLMANLTAMDMGFIGRDEFLLRTKRMLSSIESAEKWHGHLYNWYSLPSLKVLPVRYVSTVDSGNLAACLLTCEQALWELKCDSLAKKAGELARNMDFRCLYNEQRAQFHIGYDAESNELSKSWYDLLASEARLTTLVAIALGQVKTKAYYSLSRLLVPTDGGRALISWSGTMFEYLMPMLFTGAVKGTLIYETAHAAVKTQIGYNRDVWGISESGYHAFDRQLYYQYRAFGIPKLSLMPTHEKEIVISPYSSALALMVKKEQAAANLYKLSKMGMLAKYGMYEAIDFSPSRIGGETGEKVCSFMAHHQGMTLCAINNVLNKENITTRFLRVPEIRAIKLLSEEKRPSMAIMIREFESSVYKNESKNTENEYKPRTVAWNKENSANSRTAQTQLLSNGTYNVLIGDDGGGYSKCHDVMLSRYRKEAEKGRNGVHFCMRHDNKVFSMSSADECIPDSGEIVLEPQGVKFSRRDGALSSRLEVCVSPNHNAEIRRLMIANHGNEDAEIEIGVFFDVCLASQAEDLSHSAFVKVRTDAEKEDGTLLFFRRSKSGSDDDGRFMHCSVVTDADDAKIRYCTDRLIMPGRGKSEKEALMTPFLQDKEIKSPVEVGFCARLTLNVKAEEAKNVSFVMGFANSRKQALSDAAELKGDVNNIISQAWTYTKNALRFEGVTKGKADMFERAVSCMLAHKAHKPHETVDCSGGVNELWRMGISGDKPIILMYVSKITQSRMVKTLLELISYMTARGVEADLVLVGEYPHEYRNELKRRIEELISAYARLSSNVYLLHGYNLSDDDKMLLRAFAAIEIESSRSLDKQFVLTDDDGEENMSARKIYPMYGRTRGSFVNRRKELLFDNGFGGFDGKTKEYVIYKDGDSMTPMPWCNILANERFGSVVSEKGGGFTWNGNSREHKLTSADNDPIYDRSSEYILISDNENGRVWNVCSYNKGNEARHGIGYTRFISQEEETDAELCVFVDSEKSVKYSVLTLTNPMMHKRCLSIMYNVEWCLGEKLNTESVQTEFDNGILFARSFRNSADSGFAYIAIPRMSVEYTGDKAHIKGGAVHAEHLNSKVGLGLGGVGALRTDITLDAGETKTIVFLLGEDSKENAHELYRKCNVEYIEERRRLLAQAWDERLGVFRVKTPDTATNIALNYLLLYQLYSSRLLGRTGYYQCGGATGYRDQLQDMLALKMTAPEKLRAHIVKCASKQFEAGDVLHWWHEPSRGIRTRCSDDKMFLPYAVCEYIETTHDASVLDEEVTFLADMPLSDRENLYCHMADSDVKASVYEHCVRAINNACTSGSHSLPLIGGCDWNDGMDELGKDGGESVWLAMFIVYVLERFIKIAHMRGDEENAERFSKIAQELRKAIEKDGWDGAWYRRAYLGDGTPLGSHINDECSIDLLSQSWAVFCDAVHAREAFDSAQAMLIDEENGIIKLLAPPFDDSKVRVGYIEEYLPGVRENGGQYTHAAAWLVIAACKLGLKNEANRFFSMLNPINHSSDMSSAKRYKTEPFALCGDVYGVGKNAGRGGWSHYTGAAGWLYNAGTEHMLGVKKVGDELFIKPNTAFDEFEFEYKFDGTIYKIKVVRDSAANESATVKLNKDNGVKNMVINIAY